MAMPLSRSITATAAAPIRASDFNTVEDCIISRKHGSITLKLDPRTLQPLISSEVAIEPRASSFAFFQASVTHGSASPIAVGVTLTEIPIGTRINAIRASLKDLSGQPVVNLRLYGGDRSGNQTANATSFNSAATGVAQTIGGTLAAPHIVGVTTNGQVVVALATVGSYLGGLSIYDIEVDIDKP